MTKIYKPTNSADDWREFLADPEKQWRTGYSAKSMAYAFEDSGGMPPEIASALRAAFHAKPEPLIVIPEYKVPLPGGRTQSQNDAFILARIGELTAAIMVEGKVEEPFGDMLSKWLNPATKGKAERLAYLSQVLGLTTPPPKHLRYQLFHRAASAIIEAARFKTDIAMMLVYSFSRPRTWFEDYAAFAGLMKCDDAKVGNIVKSGRMTARPLYLGWVTGDPEYLSR